MATVQSTLAEANQKVSELKAQLAAADPAEYERQISDLTERLTGTELTKGDDRPVVKVKGEMCLFVAKQANIPNRGVMTAQQIIDDKKLLEELYDNGSFLLQRMKKKEAA